MRRTFSFLCMIASLGASFGAKIGVHEWIQTESDARLLEPGTSVRREISGEQSQVYRLRTPPERYVRVRLEQEGVDVSISRVGPNRETLLKTDRSKIGGEESFSYLEAKAGEQWIVVRVAGSRPAAGAYRIWIETLETPGPKDIDRASAERLLASAGLQSRDEAIESLEQALSLWRIIGDSGWEAETLNALGEVAFQSSRYQEAVEYHDRALVLSQKLHDPTVELRARSHMADSFLRSNRPEKAIEQYETALELYRDAQDRSAEGSTLDRLSDAYLRLGLTERAIESRDHALKLKQSLGDQEAAAETLAGLGRVYFAVGQYDQAMDRYERALSIYQERAMKKAESSVLASLGQAALEKGDRAKAIKRLGQALVQCRETGDRRCESQALCGLGRVHALTGERDRARREFEQSRALGREIRNPGLEAQALLYLATAERAWGGPELAQSLIENALKLVDSFSVDVYVPEQPALPNALAAQSYGFYIDLLMKLDRANPGKGYDAMAFGASERARTRRKVEIFAESRFDLRKNVDRALRDRKRTLNWRMNDLSRRLSWRRPPTETAGDQREWDRLETDLVQATATLRRDSPPYAALTGLSWTDLPGIQEHLDDETLAFAFWLGDDRSFLWVIGRDSFDSFELPEKRRIEEAALKLHEFLTARNKSIKDEPAAQTRARVAHADVQLPIAARALSQMLLGPAANRLKTKRLAIIADGALQYIPFAMLPPPSRESVDAKGSEAPSPPGANERETGDKNASPTRVMTPSVGEALLFDHEISYLESASCLALPRRDSSMRAAVTSDVAVIADPVFYANDKRIRLISARPAAEHPRQGTNKTLLTAAILEQFGHDYGGETSNEPMIPRLSYTQVEADRILAASPSGSTNLRALGFLASRATAESAHLAQYRYLHFAAYGLLDGRTPSLSTLVLSLVNHAGESQNGLLRPSDIYELNLPAELVTLSACQAKLENGRNGEGLLGFTESFQYAGAARVMISLWNVNHKSGADFMFRFYQKILRENLGPAAALRAVQLDLLRQRPGLTPYFWAGFSLYGDLR